MSVLAMGFSPAYCFGLLKHTRMRSGVQEWEPGFPVIPQRTWFRRLAPPFVIPQRSEGIRF
jgi:hypothetical protein